MASPQEMAEYYAGYPDPEDSTTWGVNEDGWTYETFGEAQAAWEAVYGESPTPSAVVVPASPGGGKPAARLSDMTAHGGLIVKGDPTTMIGGLPAARVGDMHICPMFDGPKPHVGGPILPPGSVTVLIGGMPAARVGDQCTCAGAPDIIARGEATTMIGG